MDVKQENSTQKGKNLYTRETSQGNIYTDLIATGASLGVYAGRAALVWLRTLERRPHGRTDV